MHKGCGKSHIYRCFLMQIIVYEFLVMKACTEIAKVMSTINFKQQKAGMTVC